MQYPFLKTSNRSIDRAYRLAVATLTANILPFRDGILETEKPVIIAGLGYDTPWTRDAAINTWNAGALVCPEVAANTLKSVIKRQDGGYIITGEYWDRIIWAIGAWQLYLCTGDKDFLTLAYEAVGNSLSFFEKTEFSEELGLFRGPACYGDGVAAYPDIYAKPGKSGIIAFAAECRELCDDSGVGIPMYSLSTNCLYYMAYIIADKMAKELGFEEKYAAKAESIKNAINKIFWNEQKGTYDYFFDKFGGCDYQEGMGISFAILFGIADHGQRESIFTGFKTTPYGIPCVWPSFERYNLPDGSGFGRHSGTVWPHIQGFWASAAAQNGKYGIFDKELILQVENALRYYQFAEIYHPLTGEMYGGRQENGKGIVNWRSEPYQTWSATALLRNIYTDLAGMKFSPEGITFAPVGSRLAASVSLTGVKYRSSVLNIVIEGIGDKIASFRVNGCERPPFIAKDETGEFDIKITLG